MVHSTDDALLPMARPSGELALMFKIKSEHTHLAVEFKARPYGHHSPELEAALDVLRCVNPEGKLIVVRTGTHEWTVAHLEGEPPRAVLHQDCRLETPEAAEWAMFKIRWAAVTGVPLSID